MRISSFVPGFPDVLIERVKIKIINKVISNIKGLNLGTFLNKVNIRKLILLKIENFDGFRQSNKHKLIVGSIYVLQALQMFQIQIGNMVSP
jgi:hypothetical protein